MRSLTLCTFELLFVLQVEEKASEVMNIRSFPHLMSEHNSGSFTWTRLVNMKLNADEQDVKLRRQ